MHPNCNSVTFTGVIVLQLEMKYLSFALSSLQESGFKLTDTRTQVVEALDKASLPLSTYDIQNLTTIPNVSVYRTVQLLVDLGLAHKVHGTKYVKCTKPKAEGCHHFMVCNDCGATEEYLDNHEHVPPSKSFVAISHTLEINGFCKKCYK